VEVKKIIKRIMPVKPEVKRKKGRPRIRWMDGVDKDLRNFGMVNWKTKAQERDGSSQMVVMPIIIIIIILRRTLCLALLTIRRASLIEHLLVVSKSQICNEILCWREQGIEAT
jgi:hypothetical protein